MQESSVNWTYIIAKPKYNVSYTRTHTQLWRRARAGGHGVLALPHEQESQEEETKGGDE